MTSSFADLPGRIAALTREHERVAVILVDAFGMEFVQRFADHPLLRRCEIEPVASMFPSTTTAHLTTLYSGLPVEEHGLYEWKVYEPLLDDIVIPLRFVYAASGVELPLAGTEVIPSPTLFEQLDVPSKVLLPAHIGSSTYSSVALSGAKVVGYGDLASGVLQLGSDGLSVLYWDAVDAAGHEHGPSSPQFERAAKHALDTIERALPAGTLVLMTADHGQVDVDAERLDLLDEIWPELTAQLRYGPAGSARDCFLHVHDPEHVIASLGERLGDRAEVVPAASLFDHVGPRLAARLGDVCVLPAPGRMAWLAAYPSHERRFRGHHGGRTEAESTTWLGTLQT